MFQTTHLIAEKLCAEHYADLRRLYQDPQVAATLSVDGEILSNDSIAMIVRKGVDHWDEHGFGYWIFRDTADGRFVGRAGLAHCQVGGNDEVEVAYAVLSEFWGRGLATEMANACLTVAFGVLELPDLVCFTLATNRASRRVMEKIGFHYERDVIHADLPHVLYRITAIEWSRMLDSTDMVAESKTI